MRASPSVASEPAQAPNTPTARQRHARAHGLRLALLALIVLGVHTLALRGSLSPATLRPAAPPPEFQALDTRVIAAPMAPSPPTPPPAPPPSPQPKTAPTPARTPPPVKPQKIQQKPVEAQTESAQTAPESIASIDAPAAAPSPTASPAGAPAKIDTVVPPAAEAAASAPPAGLQTTPITAMALPPSVELSYQMTGSAGGLSYQANAQLDWTNAGSRYDSRISVSAFLLGSRSVDSRGEIGPAGLAPLRFADTSRKRELAAHFEADKKRITFSSNAPPAAWIPGAQDRLSVFMQLSGMLAGNPAAFPLGATISVYTAGPRSAEIWSFLVEAEELLQLPLGELAAIKLTSQLRHDYDRRLEIWYAPALGYLPARFRYTQVNQDFIDQQLRAVRPM